MGISTPESKATPSIQAEIFTQTTQPAVRFIGVAFNTYLIYEESEELILICTNTAHERISCEKLKKENPKDEAITKKAQSLLIPEAIEFPLK